jgi:hypothetical protein
MMKSNYISAGISWTVLLVAACTPSIIEPIGLGVGGGCDALGAGCGGSAQDSVHGGEAGSANVSHAGQSPVAPGGSGNLDPGTSGAGNGPAVPAEGGITEPGACVGTLDEVAAAWWGHCPPTLCAGLVWAETCPAIPGETTEVGTCGELRTISLEFGTHGKACYYQLTGLDGGEPKLVGAAAWDDTPTYCDQTSFRIKAGIIPGDCELSNDFEVVCGSSLLGAPDPSGGADGGAGADGDDTPPKAGPKACYDALSSSCQPCCPTETPDCTGKPNGYPGYRCTQAPNSSCSCACASEAWSCGC